MCLPSTVPPRQRRRRANDELKGHREQRSKKSNFLDSRNTAQPVDSRNHVKNIRRVRAKGTKPVRVVVAGDTCVSAQGLATIIGRDKRYQVCGSAHGFYDAGELIRKHQPDVLLIEPFLEDRDGIWWIKDLAAEFPRTRSGMFQLK